MIAQLFRTAFSVLLLSATLWQFAGCNLPSGFPKEFADVAKVTAKMVADQGVMDKFTSDLRGHIKDPGLESYTSVTFAAGTRIVGTDGDISLNTAGEGTKLPKGLRESLIGQLNGPISDAQREAILAVLGWNRTTKPPDAGG